MNLTREYFDKALKGLATKSDLKTFAIKDDLKRLATKDDLKQFPTKAELDDRFEHQTRLLMSYTDQQIEKLAVMVAEGFDEMKTLLDVRERVEKLEKEVRNIKEASHV